MSSGWPKDLFFILMHRSMLNETELARKCRCSLSTISRIIGGGNTPHDNLRCRIARTLHIHPKILTQILKGDESAYRFLLEGTALWRVGWHMDPHDVPHPVTMTSMRIPGFELASKMAQLHQERFGEAVRFSPHSSQ